MKALRKCPVKKLKTEYPLMISCKPSPIEESWSYLCPCCGKKVKIRLNWDSDACEYQIEIEEEK